MADHSPYSVSYDRGTITTYTPNLRAHELVLRVKWFINLRWFAATACFTGAAAAAFSLVPAKLNPIYFISVGVFLSIANIAYTFIGRNIFGDETEHRALTILLVVQMLADFLCLSVLTYACGSIETPLVILFMAHIILATLFFRRSATFAIAGAAWFFASLPLFLEWAGVLPILSIFEGQFKVHVINSTEITGGFIFGTGAIFFVCWYLVSVITSSLKLREIQLEEAYRKIVQIDREKTQSTLRATHELKAPFAAIKSYVYTLRDGYCGPLPEKAVRVVEKIGDRCDRLTRKISGIIHLSNLKTLVVNLAPVDIVLILAAEVREGALVAEPRQIAVVSTIDTAESIQILGSSVHLRTLFSNLIRNAISYSNDKEGKVEVSLEKSAHQVSVTVKDNGIGIPENNLSKIFDEHFRSSNAVNHDMSGTGLGLSIVKEIARLHGATIEVESTVGKGSSFRIRFDLKDSKQEREHHGEHTYH